MSTRKIDLIIPVYKNADLTKKCIDSLVTFLGEIKGREPRLILIHDSPGHAETRQMLDKFQATFSDAIILENTVNIGFVKSVNRGLELSVKAHRDVLLINSDTQTFSNTLAEILSVTETDPMIGFACPRSNNAALCTFPHLPNPFGGQLPTPEQAHDRWEALSNLMPRITFAPTAVGFYLFIKYEILAMFGGLRQDFGVGYEEENDLVMRANKVGYRAVMANHAFAYHYGAASFSLSDLDLDDHRTKNLNKMVLLHPEFLPLVHRYEASAGYRAEKLLGNLLVGPNRKYKIVIDLLNLGPHHNGTSELAVQVVKEIQNRWSHRFELALLCSIETFKFHKFDNYEGLTRRDMADPGLHTVAITLGQPFDVHRINVLETTAPINIFGMLDVIALDCGHIRITHDLEKLWAHIAEYANGIFYISKYSRASFVSRFPIADHTNHYTKLLPTSVSAYSRKEIDTGVDHILVLGNHFPHKASDYTAALIAKQYPNLQVISLGGESCRQGNLQILRAGEIAESVVESLFAKASVIVLPSFVEGFGFGFMHALAAKKPIVARKILATQEILDTFEIASGIYLFEDNEGLMDAIKQAVNTPYSMVVERTAKGWDDWVNGLMTFVIAQIDSSHTFHKLCERISAGDRLRSALITSPQAVGATPQNTKLIQNLVLPFAPLQLSRSIEGAELSKESPFLGYKGNAEKCLDQTEFEDNKLKLNDSAIGTADGVSLLDGNDFQFLRNAYLILLQREPDEDGKSNYQMRLSRGDAREQILMELYESEEAKLKKVQSIELDQIRQSMGAKRKDGFLKWFK